MRHNFLLPMLRPPANTQVTCRTKGVWSSVQTMIRHLVFMCGLLAFFTQPAFAETTVGSVPENAHKSSYGDGWECDRSYRAAGSTCIAVVVPQNAYPTHRNYGSGWECLHGFIEVKGASCAKVLVPDGGYLAPSGRRWNCLRGYRKIDDICQKIILPPDAFLTDRSNGPGWMCRRGFQAKGDTCVVIEVPENAYLKASAFGPQWKCERGFAVSRNRCIEIVLPDNAHLARTGNRWECNKNFQHKNGRCVLNN